MPKVIRVVIADDHPIFRQGLSATIEKDKNISVVGEAENGKVAIDLVESLDPDVVVLDIDMPIKDGIEAARELKATNVQTKVVFLTMHKDTSILRSMRSLGVKGYVLKDSALSEIVRCISTVMAGDIYLSPGLNDVILDNVEPKRHFDISSLINLLSQAERNVLKLVTDSKTSREIAAELFITIRTVETHRYNICSKLDLNGPNAIFKFALQHKDDILSRI